MIDELDPFNQYRVYSGIIILLIFPFLLQISPAFPSLYVDVSNYPYYDSMVEDYKKKVKCNTVSPKKNLLAFLFLKEMKS